MPHPMGPASNPVRSSVVPRRKPFMCCEINTARQLSLCVSQTGPIVTGQVSLLNPPFRRSQSWEIRRGCDPGSGRAGSARMASFPMILIELFQTFEKPKKFLDRLLSLPVRPLSLIILGVHSFLQDEVCNFNCFLPFARR